ncbi:MAG: hypothetical protein M3446_05260 [Actinomycetota bacterium]|nr:hypothetical protein [Actinomycetota bacterium]
MFEGADTVTAEPIGGESWNRYEEEISEAEWLADQHYQQRAEQITDLTDAEAITELIKLEASLSAQHARRARLVAHVAGHRPAAVDRPADQPGAAATQCADDQVPEILDVSEWLPHELQMAHPYSWTAVQDLVQTSLVLTGRLSARPWTCSGRVGSTTCGPGSWPTCSGPAPSRSRTPSRRWCATQGPRAHPAADVGYYPTQDGMARFYADLPLAGTTARSGKSAPKVEQEPAWMTARPKPA